MRWMHLLYYMCDSNGYTQRLEHGRATSGPRARSGPRRPSVRPATLLGNNIAIQPAIPQQTNAGFMSEITHRVNVRTNSEHFGQWGDATSSAKKRNVDIEHRTFNPAWKEKYFFIERFGQAQCLICLKTVYHAPPRPASRQSIEHQTLRRRIPRWGKTPSIDCQATCRKQLRSSASRLLGPTRYCVPVMTDITKHWMPSTWSCRAKTLS